MMVHLSATLVLASLLVAPTGALASEEQTLPPDAADLRIGGASVRYISELDLLVFEQSLEAAVGSTTIAPVGSLDGAPVLGYVFPTDLEPTDVGFGAGDGTVALAATVHPDFDDTPLWDENNDRVYDNDGFVFHSHWVVLVPDKRAPGGLAVQQIRKEEITGLLPPTNPGMPMLMDSPGFSVVLRGNRLSLLVPAQRVGGRTDFSFDAVVAFMRVSTDDDEPLLGVQKVYSVLSGDLSLPYRVEAR